MSVDVHHHAILASLEPLFGQADADGLWFHHQAGMGKEIWCSPEFLRREQSQGRLMMGPEHWELLSPVGYLKSIIADVTERIAEYNALAAKLGFAETLAVESHSNHPADRH